MDLLTQDLRARLRANHEASSHPGHDPAPVVKFFNPCGAGTWLATELYPDGDTLFGLADLGFGCPELGVFSLAELAGLRLPFGLAIERDLHFEGLFPLSAYAEAARSAGGIVETEAALRRSVSARNSQLPPPLDDQEAG
jgi:hypothetical protein